MENAFARCISAMIKVYVLFGLEWLFIANRIIMVCTCTYWPVQIINKWPMIFEVAQMKKPFHESAFACRSVNVIRVDAYCVVLTLSQIVSPMSKVKEIKHWHFSPPERDQNEFYCFTGKLIKLSGMMLTHTHQHNPLGIWNWPSAITRLTVHCTVHWYLVSDLIIDKLGNEWCHLWLWMSLLRPGIF